MGFKKLENRDLNLRALKIFSTGNSSISFRVFRYPHALHTNGSEHSNKITVLFVRRGAGRRRGGAGLLQARMELFYLIGAEKYTRVSDLTLIFFCILDEAAADEETKV